jgi:hypothetical protein
MTAPSSSSCCPPHRVALHGYEGRDGLNQPVQAGFVARAAGFSTAASRLPRISYLLINVYPNEEPLISGGREARCAGGEVQRGGVRCAKRIKELKLQVAGGKAQIACFATCGL